VSLELDHGSTIRDVRYSADGRRLLVRTWETVRIWDPDAFSLLATIRHPSLTAAALDSTGERVVTGAADGALQLWLLPPADPSVRDWAAGWIPAVADGHIVVSRDPAGAVSVRDLFTREVFSGPWTNAAEVKSAAWSGATREAFLADGAGNVWRAAVGEPAPRKVISDLGPGTRVRSSDSGEWLATFSETNSQVELRRRTNWKEVVGAWSESAGISRVTFDPRSERALVVDLGGAARVWDLATGGSLTPVLLHPATVGAARFSPDGLRLVTGVPSDRPHLWDVETGLWLAAPSETRLAWLGASNPEWTAEGHGLALPWLTQIPGCSETIEHLMHQAVVTSGRSFDGAGRIVPIEISRLAKVWEAMTNRPGPGVR